MNKAEDGAVTVLKERFENYMRVNKERITVASRILSSASLHIMDILPCLLHFNHPKIPCYVPGSVPCGIDCFKPSASQQKYVLEQTHDENFFKNNTQKCSIYGLFAMGSTSSIGQGARSDLDVWVCVKSGLDEESLYLLNQKCKFISTLAKALDVDVNLFVTPEDRFTRGIHDCLDNDNCGSAQNLLLLDEFYRSAIYLAGRYLIWYMISSDQEREDYTASVQKAYDSGAFNKDEWFDFGPVTITQPAEYFGSALWLLYKGIDSPFKATVKILLMESYSADFPSTRLLCTVFKDNLHKGCGFGLDLDPYYLMYRKVAEYLIRKNDLQRLLLVRMCFYLKIYEGLNGISSGRVLHIKKELLKSFRDKWQWGYARTELVESSDSWKIDFVQKLYDILFRSLIKSYRELLSFSVRQGIEYAITSDDAGILSRKLFVAFDRYEGKINVLASDFTKSLEEANLTFLCPSRGSLCKPGWHVFPAPANSVAMLETNVAYIHEKISSCIAWSCFNGLLTSNTQVDVAGNAGDVSPKKIKSLAYDIKHYLMSRRHRANDLQLQRPREIRACLVILNFEQDETSYARVSSPDLNMGSSLCYGRNRNCLVGSIDLILINSWGELRSIPLPSGEEGVVKLIVTLILLSRISAFKKSGQITDIVRVCCYAGEHRDLIRFDVESLIRRVFMLQDKNNDGEEYSFDVGINTYLAKNSGERGIRVSRYAGFSGEDLDVYITSDFAMRPEFFLQVPPIVERFSTLGIMQYFFVPEINRAWRIIIVNEHNEVEIYKHYVGSRSVLVNAINRFYIKQTEGHKDTDYMHFNLPQYFVLSQDLKHIHPFTINIDA